MRVFNPVKRVLGSLWTQITRGEFLKTQKPAENLNKMDENKTKNLNVFLLGLAFMLIFTAFQTMGNVETTILNSAKNPKSSGYVEAFSGSGYVSLAIIYITFAFSNWMAPPVLALMGAKFTMVLGSVFYGLFIAQFFYPNTILLYGSSLLLGCGAALIWTAQGNFLTLNSDEHTMSRNSGLFWAMLQTSMLIGNTLVYFQFKGENDIGLDTRNALTESLLVICCIGIALLFTLRPTPWVRRRNDLPSMQGANAPLTSVRSAWTLALTRTMLMLSLTFFYTGLELTFWSGVYGPSIGFTLNFGDIAKSLVGLHGIAIGAGEILGGLLFGIFGHVIVRRGRDPVVILGFLLHVLAFFLIFLNIPNQAPFGDTHQYAFISSNAFVAIFCSFLIGFGDACFNTQIYTILGVLYADDSAPAFAIFKFVQSLAAAVAFFYSDVFSLYYQLLILVCFCILGTLSFVRVEFKSSANNLNSNPSAIITARDELQDNLLAEEHDETSNDESDS